MEKPFDSKRLRNIDLEINGSKSIGDEQKRYLRDFVRVYGRRERKRARDQFLRDPDICKSVLEIRKCTAFKGYSYKRMAVKRPTLVQAGLR